MEALIFSWLFGGKKSNKKQRRPGGGSTAKKPATLKQPPKPPVKTRVNATGTDWRDDPDKVVSDMGGAEELAKVIRSLLQEDKARR